MSDSSLKSRRVRTSLRALLGAAVLLTSISGSVTSAAPQVGPSGVVTDLSGMRILVTNDDGVQSAAVGTYELRKALCNAGADVVVVGPWADQSGASMSLTFGSSSFRFALDTPDIPAAYAGDCGGSGAVFGACRVPTGSPADCAGATTLTPGDAATLGAFFVRDEYGWADGPDLVVSGINRGGNDGLNVNISGTVGAATIASSLGYPAIAVSASSSGDPVAASQWTVGFVGTLRANQALPADYVLNVNYPSGNPALALWTSVAQTSPLATGYARQGDDLLFGSTFGPCVPGPRCGPAAPGTDSAVYGSGSISISPVGVNRTVGAGADVARAQLLVMTGLFDRPSPMTVDGCKQGGWQLRGFQNQGACVRAFA